MGQVKLSEWFWRFLATVMLFSVAWTMWIIYQLNPTPLVMNAAFEAAAKAKVNAGQNPNAGQNVHGVITPPPAAPEPAPPKEPPINPDKLKLSDSIATLPGATK